MAEDILCPSCKRKSVHIPCQVCRVILCFDCVVQNHGHFAFKEAQDVQLVYKLCKSCNENKNKENKSPNKRESNEQPAKTAAPSTRTQGPIPESGKPETDAPLPPSTHHQGAIPKAKKPETVSRPPLDICPKCQNRMPVYRICEKCDRGHAYMCLDGDCWAINPAWLDPNKRSPSWVCSKCQQKPSATIPGKKFEVKVGNLTVFEGIEEELERNLTGRVVHPRGTAEWQQREKARENAILSSERIDGNKSKKHSTRGTERISYSTSQRTDLGEYPTMRGTAKRQEEGMTKQGLQRTGRLTPEEQTAGPSTSRTCRASSSAVRDEDGKAAETVHTRHVTSGLWRKRNEDITKSEGNLSSVATSSASSPTTETTSDGWQLVARPSATTSEQRSSVRRVAPPPVPPPYPSTSAQKPHVRKVEGRKSEYGVFVRPPADDVMTRAIYIAGPTDVNPFEDRMYASIHIENPVSSSLLRSTPSLLRYFSPFPTFPEAKRYWENICKSLKST